MDQITVDGFNASDGEILLHKIELQLQFLNKTGLTLVSVLVDLHCSSRSTKRSPRLYSFPLVLRKEEEDDLVMIKPVCGRTLLLVLRGWKVYPVDMILPLAPL